MVFSALVTTFIAIYLDTKFYTVGQVTWSALMNHPVITPLNNLTYNLASSNLAKHGLHPYYQHVLVNLPLLLGPAALLLFTQPHLSLRLYSAISGVFVLSIFQHQEARFLLPTIPLILSSVKLPKNKTRLRIWAGIWIVFNVFFWYIDGGVPPRRRDPNANLSQPPTRRHDSDMVENLQSSDLALERQERGPQDQ